MTWTTQPAAVLSDMDGTLVDSTALIENQWQTFLEWYDISPEQLPGALHGKRAEEHIRELLPAERVPEALSRYAVLEESSVEGIVAIPGAAAVIDELNDLRIPWAMVTSGTAPVVRARMEAAGLPQPRHLVSAEDVTVGKPDPQPYLRGRELLGVHGPILALEDTPVGVSAAKGAGLTVAAVATTHQPSELDADIVIRDLRELHVNRDDTEFGFVIRSTMPDLRAAA